MGIFQRAQQRFEDWLVAKKRTGFDKEIREIQEDLRRISTGWRLSGIIIEHDGSTEHDMDAIDAFYRRARGRFRRLIKLLGYEDNMGEITPIVYKSYSIDESTGRFRTRLQNEYGQPLYVTVYEDGKVEQMLEPPAHARNENEWGNAI